MIDGILPISAYWADLQCQQVLRLQHGAQWERKDLDALTVRCNLLCDLHGQSALPFDVLEVIEDLDRDEVIEDS